MANTPAAELASFQNLAALPGTAPDRHPVSVYLASLGSGSRRSTSQALARVTQLATDGRLGPMTFPWPALRYQHTAAIRALLLEQGAPATANRILAALRGVLKECWRLGYMGAEDYHRAVDLKSAPGQRLPAGRMLTAGELASLFSSCADDRAPGARLDAAILALLVGCGLRRSEAAALDLGDYGREDGSLRVRHGKGGRERLVPVVNGQRGALEAWIEARGSEAGALICPVDKAGRVEIRRMTSQALYMRLAKRGQKAGVQSFSPHDLRRTFISALLDHGADISAVQRLAGHANVTTTTRYDRRGENAKIKAAKLIHIPF